VSVSDDEIVDRVRGGEGPLFELLMRRYNQRLYRVARAIVRDEHEAEDVMQAAYVAAYTHLAQYARRAKFSTWLTRIAVHEALARTRRRARWAAIPSEGEADRGVHPPVDDRPDPERQAQLGELRRVLEAAIDDLPERYRTAFVLREAEGLATGEVAECLEISEEAVRTRVHRARVLLRRRLYERTGATAASAFSFHLVRCDRVVAGVFGRLPDRAGRTAPAREAVSGRGANGVESAEHQEHDDDLGPGSLPDLRLRRSRHDRGP
jgi:RNA polymerase sigma-70 factor (ECF subfamily)